MVAAKSPMTTKEIERPPASAAGPSRCSDAAAPSTIGKIGSTHGERMETMPATKANGIAPAPMARGQRVLSSSAPIEARLVSPTERPVSLSPLNAIKVDWVRTPNAFTASFWPSKSITK